MSQFLQIDPVAKDYVVVNGSPVESDRVQEAVYYALTIPQGQWMYGTPDQGSQLYQLEGAKRTTSVEQSFAAYATTAVQAQVIDTGIATAVQVNNLATSRTGSSNQIEVVPAATQISNQLNFVSVG